MKTYITLLSATLVATMASCSREETKTEVKEELPLVTVDVVHSQAVPQQREYTANVEAENLNNIAPSTPNRIKTIRVDVGDRVQAGQTLVTLDSSNSD